MLKFLACPAETNTTIQSLCVLQSLCCKAVNSKVCCLVGGSINYMSGLVRSLTCSVLALIQILQLHSGYIMTYIADLKGLGSGSQCV